MPSVLYIGHLAKIFISIMEGILKKIHMSDATTYESVDKKANLELCHKKRRKKNSGTNVLIYSRFMPIIAMMSPLINPIRRTQNEI